jgi:hypothetical protein
MNTRHSVVLFLFVIQYTHIYTKEQAQAVSDIACDQAIQNNTQAKKKSKRKLNKKYRRSRKPGKVSSFITTPNLNIKSMSYEQLSQRVPELIKEGNVRAAGKYLNRMATLSTDPDLIADHEIQIADLLFQRGKYQKATIRYNKFAQLNSGNKKHAEYASYRACESSSKCLYSFDRCQEQTHSTIKLCDNYLTRPLFTTYREKVQAIRAECYTLLVQSEMGIWSECINNNNTKGAEIHLAYVEKDLACAYPPATLLAQSYKKAHGFDDIIEKPDTLVIAQQTKKPHMADRF